LVFDFNLCETCMMMGRKPCATQRLHVPGVSRWQSATAIVRERVADHDLLDIYA